MIDLDSLNEVLTESQVPHLKAKRALRAKVVIFG